MRKGISPLIATVLLIAMTLAVATIIGSWFTGITKTQTEMLEENTKKQINCTGALLSISDVICSSTNQQLTIAISNLGDTALYGFSTLVKINNTYYENSTGGPTSTSALDPGEQTILVYPCSNTTYCVNNAVIESLRISPTNCPSAWTVSTEGRTCT